MRIRLNGPADEVTAAAELLRLAFGNVDTSGPYPDRGRPDVRLYVNCDMPADVVSHMLAVAEHARERALRAAWPNGVDIPAQRVRAGDQMLRRRRWELVDELHIDATVPRSDSVAVYTNHMGSDDAPYPYPLDAPVRVRRQPEEGQ